jgi:tRNA pseudouridine13 synthase
MQVTASGGLFVSTDPTTDQPRVDSREIVPTGPMFGPEMKSPVEVAAAREDEVLHAAGLNRDTFERFRNLTSGTRRALIVWPEELTIEPGSADLVLRFELPPGVYATSVLREFQKADGRPESLENS